MANPGDSVGTVAECNFGATLGRRNKNLLEKVSTKNGNVGNWQQTPVSALKAPGQPALKKQVVFDKESSCAAPNGSFQCIAISAPLGMSFGGKRVTIEGLSQGDKVLVRLMRAVDDSFASEYLRTGDLILSWPSAVKQIESCNVKAAFQPHSLDVYLTLRLSAKGIHLST